MIVELDGCRVDCWVRVVLKEHDSAGFRQSGGQQILQPYLAVLCPCCRGMVWGIHEIESMDGDDTGDEVYGFRYGYQSIEGSKLTRFPRHRDCHLAATGK